MEGRNMRWQRGTIPRAPNQYHMGAPKSPNNIANTFFNTLHLLPKELRFEPGGIMLASSCPGRHLTSLRPCLYVSNFSLLEAVSCCTEVNNSDSPNQPVPKLLS